MKVGIRHYLVKTCTFITAAVIILGTATFCFASETSNVRHFTQTESSYIRSGTYYNRVNSAVLNFYIKKGCAVSTMTINAKSSKAMDSAKITMEFMNKKTGKGKTYSGTMRKSGIKYIYSKSYKLPRKGKYYIKAKVKCYNHGRLVETISKVSDVRVYGK